GRPPSRVEVKINLDCITPEEGDATREDVAVRKEHFDLIARLRAAADQTEHDDRLGCQVDAEHIPLLREAADALETRGADVQPDGWPIPCLACGAELKEGERFHCAACARRPDE